METHRTLPRAWTRRQFLGLGAAATASAALAACGATTTSSTTTKTEPRDRSRPDLHPSLAKVIGPNRSTSDGYVFVSPSGPLILDGDGEPVWIHPVPHASTDLKLQHYKGEPVLTWWQGEVASYGVGRRGECVMLDTSYRQMMTITAKNGLHADLHEFVIDKDNTAYLTAYREVTADLSAMGGPKKATMLDAVIQGIDLESGDLTFEWHSADHIEITESMGTYGKAPYDPVHINSIQPLDDNSLLVSARNTWTIYKIDLVSGDITWRLGGKKTDFDLGENVRFAWQHDARRHPGGIVSVFDDEAAPAEAQASRALVLHVDESSMKAIFVREYRHPDKTLLAGSQGSVQLLDSGNVVVGWGAEPYYSEFDEDGSLVLDGSFDRGQSYRAYRFSFVGTPKDTPAVAVERTGGSHVTVYASWNGATTVESWRVLAGNYRSTLDALHRAPRRGFETSIPIQTTARYFAVAALDDKGTVLATSHVVTARDER